MKKDYTDITVILDRSGSMNGKEEFVESGFKEFIEDQKQDEGQVLVSAVQFDTKYEKVFSGVDVQANPSINLKPRGMTALYDAIGRAINETGQRFAALLEDQRPENVIFLIVTDGLENASKEFTSEKIKNMIQHQENKYSWQFIYLGSNQDAVIEAQKFGIIMDKAATYSDIDEKGHIVAWNTMSRMTNTYKDIKSMSFTDEERAEVMK